MIQNTEYILKTPEGRAMATAKALGVDVAALFGSRKPAIAGSTETYVPAETSNPEPAPAPEPENENSAAKLAAEAAADEEPDFPEDTEGKTQQETEFERLTGTLEEYMTFKDYLNVTTKSGTNPYKLAQDELSNTAATEDSRKKMIQRLRDFLIAKKVPGVA
jgi:hypothetical protein